MDAASDNALPQDASRSPGMLLAAERERQGLSRADVAQRLHMSAGQIEALESGDYARLPRGTFLRGFVRNYARILGQDPEVMLGALASDAPGDKAPAIVVPSQNIRFDPIGARLSSPYVKAVAIAATAIVLGFAALYWWFYIRPLPLGGATTLRKSVAEAPKVEARVAEAHPAAPPPAQAVAAAPEVAAPVVEPPKAEPAKPERVKPEAPKAESARIAAAKSESAKAEIAKDDTSRSAKPESATEAAPIDTAQVIAAGGGVVRLRFKGSSWVEIKDGRGKLLLSRVNPGGSEAEVSGRPPFSVIVGNAPDVELTYNNRTFDLEPWTRVAVARFTLPPQ